MLSKKAQYAFQALMYMAEKPANVLGLAVPGMPAGSPGMEVPGRKDAYDVIAFTRDGKRSIYAKR